MTFSEIAGRAAFAGAWASLVLGPVHALSRFATAAGAEDLELPGVRAWAEPAARVLRPLLTWADPQTVYLTYGKLWLFIIGAVTLCAFAVRQSRVAAGQVRGVERIGWWVALPGYAVLTVSIVGEYWTPFLEESFALLALPGLLIAAIGSLLLGIGLLRRGVRPRTGGWLLILFVPLFFVISDLIAMGAALWPVIWAWGLLGRKLYR